MYSNNTVGVAAHCSTDVILQSMELAMPWCFIKQSKFPLWFSHALIYCIRNKELVFLAFYNLQIEILQTYILYT